MAKKFGMLMKLEIHEQKALMRSFVDIQKQIDALIDAVYFLSKGNTGKAQQECGKATGFSNDCKATLKILNRLLEKIDEMELKTRDGFPV